MLLRILNKRHSNKPRRGFTLVELAVVMGVIGVVTAGLWRLSGVGNLQNKDQATAQQQLLLISAVKQYLADVTGTGGQTLLQTEWTAAGGKQTTFPLTLPKAGTNDTLSDCQTNLAATNPGLCTYLPRGFDAGTTNPYGQTYSIGVQTGPTVANQAYSFMITTSGGTKIPDADGGRISSLIGGDGGFDYANSVCGNTICGALGAWSASPATYGLGAGTAGTVASLSFVSTASNYNFSWLARSLFAVDVGVIPPVYNTMGTDLYMGLNGTTTNGTNINFPGSTQFPLGGAYQFPPAGTYTPGAINLGNSYITANGSNAYKVPQVTFFSNGASYEENNASFIQMTTGCTAMATTYVYGNKAAAAAQVTVSGDPNDYLCAPAISIITGDINITTGAFVGQNVLAGSDRKLKKDIHPIKNALDGVMKLDPVAFTYRSTDRQSMGVIAQDLEKVYPELVTNYRGTKYVEYNGLTGALIGAVQELKHQNDDLREQLRLQSERLDRLEHQNSTP